MSVFKPLSSQDVIVTPFLVHKKFRIVATGDDGLSNFYKEGIDRYTGELKPPTNFEFDNEENTGEFYIQKTRSVYDSIRQLYYSNYLTQNENLPENQILASGSYDNFLTSLTEDDRYLPQVIGSQIEVISIPQRLFGDYIKPGTFKYFWGDEERIGDDGEGNVKYTNLLTGEQATVGNIIYSHGIISVTLAAQDAQFRFNSNGFPTTYGSASYGNEDGEKYGGIASSFRQFVAGFNNDPNAVLEFESSHTIFESQYKCTLRESEFNYSYNPSLITGSASAESGSSEYVPFVITPEFSPYITTVGLYNEKQELLAVGKLAQPLPSSPTTDTTILINIDK